MEAKVFYCSACHFRYIPADARDRNFCPDCGQAAVSPAGEEQKNKYGGGQGESEQLTKRIQS